MARFIIFVNLLAVLFTRGTSDTLFFYDGIYANVQIKPPETAEKCVMVTNKNETHDYKPDGKTITDHLYSIDNSWSNQKTCSFRINRINEEDAGNWKITVYGKQGSHVVSYKIYVKKQKNIVPWDRIQVYDNQYVSLKFAEEFANLTSCMVSDPSENEINILKTNTTNIQRFGQCGMRIFVNSTRYDGEWEIAAIVNDSIIYFASFTLTMKKTEQKEQQEIIQLERGTHGKITVGPTASFCQLIDPHGTSLPLIYGSCDYTIPKVTSQLDGIWYARYGIEGKIKIEEMNFKIETYDVPTVYTSVNITKEGDAKLTCRSEMSYVQFCRFIRPDGTTINISPGVGDDRYFSYLEVAERSSDSVVCGLMIRNPNLEDYGSWKCEMAKRRDNNIRGAILKLNYPIEWKVTNVVSTRGGVVQVKHGDEFTVKCTADDALDYCRLRSPNGTSFYVTGKNSNAKFTLEYDGSGLSLGECGATIKAANYTDQGKWSCFMGVVNGSEVEATVSVTVTESYLVPSEEVLTLSKSSILSCHVLPHLLDIQIDYCRWIRPDGYGIHNGIAQRYATLKHNSGCQLTILGNNFPEDIGRWTCVAGLSGRVSEEALAHIDLRSESMQMGTLIAIITGACVLLTITACAFLFVNIRNRRRSLPKNPPPYNPDEYVTPQALSPTVCSITKETPYISNDYIPPKSLNPSHVTKENQF